VRSALPPRAINAILQHHLSGMEDVGGLSPEKCPRFLGMILSICDGVADCCHMDMFEPSSRTLEEIQESPEVRWLNKFGDVHDLRSLAQEELTRSQEIFDVFLMVSSW